jgi:hypothetical protein
MVLHIVLARPSRGGSVGKPLKQQKRIHHPSPQVPSPPSYGLGRRIAEWIRIMSAISMRRATRDRCHTSLLSGSRRVSHPSGLWV